MRTSPLRIMLSEQERCELEHIVRSPSALNGHAQRARCVLLFAGGWRINAIAAKLELQRRIVRKWLQRFAQGRLKGLADEPRPGRPPVFSPRSGLAPREDGLRAAG